MLDTLDILTFDFLLKPLQANKGLFFVYWMELNKTSGPAHGVVTKSIHKTLPGWWGGGLGWRGREWRSIVYWMELNKTSGPAHGVVTKKHTQKLCQDGGVGGLGWRGRGWRSDIRTTVKSLKIDIARNCESSLLKITYLNIFVENHKKLNSFGKRIFVMSFCQGWLWHHITSCHMTSNDVIWYTQLILLSII